MKPIIALVRASITALGRGGAPTGSAAGYTEGRSVMPDSRESRRRRRFAPKGLILLLVALLALGPNLNAASVRAADPPIVPPVIPNPNPDPSTTYSPAPLLRFGLLEGLQQQAIQNVLTGHGLPASDAAAVQSWARNDATAELWALVVEAIKTKADERTSDQQVAVDWLTGLVRAKRMDQARYAGQEYVKWAGYSQEDFDYFVDQYYDAVARGEDTTAAKNDLKDYLKQQPLNFNLCNGGSCIGLDVNQAWAQAQAGYCTYKAPAPYENAYPGENRALPDDCFVGGLIGPIFGTPPVAPEYEEFVAWGEARANLEAINNPEFAITFRDVALVVGLGTVTAGMVAAGALGVTLAPVLAGTAFQLAVFPFAGKVSSLSSAALAAIGSPATNSAAVAAANAGAVSAAGVGAIVAAVILFIVVTTIHLINLVTLLELPDKLHELVVQAPTKSYDIRPMLDDEEGVGELYSLFIQATLPLPKIDARCDNRIMSPGIVPCLNPPPPPPANSQADPAFMVSVNGGDETFQNTITWYNKATERTTTARLKRVWFIQQVTDSEGTTLSVVNNDGVARQEIQSLRIMYTDWDGKLHYAWLIQDEQGAYKFVSMDGDSGETLNVETCSQDGTCAVSDSIRYVDSDENQYEARIVPPPRPVIDPDSISFSPENPKQGEVVELSAQATSPIGADLEYRWRITTRPPRTICVGGCEEIVTVTGNPATYAFPTSGEFAIQLVVTDSDNREAKHNFTVDVTAVPAELRLLQPCPDDPLLGCLPGIHNVVKVPQGTATVVEGAILHTGPHDVLKLTVDWGDETSHQTSNTSPQCHPSADPTCGIRLILPTQKDGDDYRLPFEAVHTYAGPGYYTVTVTLEYPAGTTVAQTIEQTVLAETTTSLAAEPSPATVGQAVTYTATVAPVPPGGTVAFFEGQTAIAGCGAQPLGADGTATCTVVPTSVGQVPITARYSGYAFYVSSSDTLTQEVHTISTTLALEAAPAASVWGEPVTFTARLGADAPGGSVPSGTVAFAAGGESIPGCAAQPLAGWTATCTTAALGIGAHAITAAYSGDAFFAASAAPELSHAVEQAATTVQLRIARDVVTVGEPVTLQATVAVVPPGAGEPSGTVTFATGATELGTVVLQVAAGEARATLTTTALPVGSHPITAVYSGDAHFHPSGSIVLEQHVNTDLSPYRTVRGRLDLRQASLAGATLVGVDLTEAELLGASLAGADLRGARLVRANLLLADLRGARLVDADLSGALLLGARLGAVEWANTVCPDGSNSDENGGTCVGHLLPTARADTLGQAARLVEGLVRGAGPLPRGLGVWWRPTG